jgi:hypothetical protein
MKAFLQFSAILLTLIVASWIVIPARYQVSYPRDIRPQFDKYIRRNYVNDIEAQHPDIVLLGDSMLHPAVNDVVLSERLNQKIMAIGLPGSASTLWYLIVKNNILEAQSPPKYLAIFFRDTMMTVPGYRVTGRYFEQIDEFAGPKDGELIKRAYLNQMNPLEKLAEAWFPPFGSRWSIRQGIDSRIRYTLPSLQLGCEQPCMNNAMEVVFGDLNMDRNFLSDALAAADDYLYSNTALNFDQQIGESFLPELIQLTREHNIQLILVRMRILRFAVPGSEPPALSKYNQGLSDYLAANGVLYLDYSRETRLSHDEFADPLHMNSAGQAIFTDLFAQDLLKFIQK